MYVSSTADIDAWVFNTFAWICEWNNHQNIFKSTNEVVKNEQKYMKRFQCNSTQLIGQGCGCVSLPTPDILSQYEAQE